MLLLWYHQLCSQLCPHHVIVMVELLLMDRRVFDLLHSRGLLIIWLIICYCCCLILSFWSSRLPTQACRNRVNPILSLKFSLRSSSSSSSSSAPPPPLLSLNPLSFTPTTTHRYHRCLRWFLQLISLSVLTVLLSWFPPKSPRPPPPSSSCLAFLLLLFLLWLVDDCVSAACFLPAGQTQTESADSQGTKMSTCSLLGSISVMSSFHTRLTLFDWNVRNSQECRWGCVGGCVCVSCVYLDLIAAEVGII